MPEKLYRMRGSRWAARAARFAWTEAGTPFPGAASLTVLEGFAAPFSVRTPRGERVVVDNGYHWVQLAPRDERWWLTGMYDARRALVQFYFDVTFENRLLPDGESFLRDAYLDVVIEPDGEARILDREELAAAVEAGEVAPEEAARISEIAETLAARFSGRAEALDALCRGIMETLLPRLRRTADPPGEGRVPE